MKLSRNLVLRKDYSGYIPKSFCSISAISYGRKHPPWLVPTYCKTYYHQITESIIVFVLLFPRAESQSFRDPVLPGPDKQPCDLTSGPRLHPARVCRVTSQAGGPPDPPAERPADSWELWWGSIARSTSSSCSTRSTNSADSRGQ